MMLFVDRKFYELLSFVNDRIALLERIAIDNKPEDNKPEHAQFWARIDDLKKVRNYLVDITSEKEHILI